MSEHEHYFRLSDDNLFALADHAQNQIEMWTKRLEKVLGIIALRYAMEEFPES